MGKLVAAEELLSEITARIRTPIFIFLYIFFFGGGGVKGEMVGKASGSGGVAV